MKFREKKYYYIKTIIYLDLALRVNLFQCQFSISIYIPGIYADWYIVFFFPFVRS